MKVTVFGLVALAVAGFAAVRGVADFFRKLTEAPAPPLPSAPSPRRPRRTRAPKQEAPPPEEPAPAPAAAAPATLAPLPPARRPSFRFRGRDALRQAIVAREVLGSPLALRPPRF
jgi:hypothetical protein